MASFIIEITVPTAVATSVLETVTNQLGYVDGETEGTRKAYLDQHVKNYLKSVYVAGKVAEQQELDAAEEDALRETNRTEQETVRQDAEAVDISVG